MLLTAEWSFSVAVATQAATDPEIHWTSLQRLDLHWRRRQVPTIQLRMVINPWSSSQSKYSRRQQHQWETTM